MNKFYCGRKDRKKKIFFAWNKQQKCHTQKKRSWHRAYKNALEMMLAIYAKPSQFGIHWHREKWKFVCPHLSVHFLWKPE